MWEARPTGKRGRQPACSDAAIRSCPTMSEGRPGNDPGDRFGPERCLAWRSGRRPALSKAFCSGSGRAGRCRISAPAAAARVRWDPGPGGATQAHRALAVDIPYRGSEGPLHLPIDSAGIKVEAKGSGVRRVRKQSGRWFSRQTRKHGGSKRRVWREIHLGSAEGEESIRGINSPTNEKTLEIRAVEFASSDIGDAPMLPELPDQIPPDQQIGSVTADGACDTRKCHDAIADRGAAAVRRGNGPPDHSLFRLTPAPQERQDLETRHRWRDCAKPSAAGIEIPRPDDLAEMERIPPPTSGRNQDALHEASRTTPHGPRPRPSGRRTPGPHRRHERLHRPRHTCHGSHGTGPSGERRSLTATRFAQQSRANSARHKGQTYCPFRDKFELV
jgi:hypothetical protein